MGVIYKLKDEVVQFIINKRQYNPLFSCRQLAEAASLQFGVRLSKSSVHDVLREYGVVTPRGRKPKDAFKIPLEKKQEIQASLSQVMLKDPVPGIMAVPVSNVTVSADSSVIAGPVSGVIASPQQKHLGINSAKVLIPDTRSSCRTLAEARSSSPRQGGASSPSVPCNDTGGYAGHDTKEPSFTKSEIYEGAGKIFLKAALWDLGIFNEDIKEEDWGYYLTYTSAIKVFLENDTSYTIDWRMPIQRGINEVADFFISNIKPFIVSKTSDDEAFKSSMEAKPGFKIKNIVIVDRNDHEILNFTNIVDYKRFFIIKNRIFVECNEKEVKLRAKILYLSQIIQNEYDINNIINFQGFNIENDDELCVNISISETYNKLIFQSAVENFNNMCIRDEKNRLVTVKIF